MRKITILLCAALAVAAMANYYQVSLSGDGKSGEENGPGILNDAAAAAAQEEASPSGRLEGDAAAAEEETHVDKPGDSK
jgi:hypothetical protein